MNRKYKLLDLFCCAGGAAKGYNDAGFEVVGVDIVQRDNYPYEFILSDALQLLEDEDFVKTFDAIHASPPCQCYSRLKYLSGDVEKWEREHVDLIPPVREKLEYYWNKYGIPYIIENVEGAPLINPIRLCGSQFPNMLTQRPRLFESCISLDEPSQKVSNMKTAKLGEIAENGTVSVCGKRNLKGFNSVQTKLYYGIALGGIDWMSLEELTQCIPPCYTEFLGTQMIQYLRNKENNNMNNTFNMTMFVKLVKEYL